VFAKRYPDDSHSIPAEGYRFSHEDISTAESIFGSIFGLVRRWKENVGEVPVNDLEGSETSRETASSQRSIDDSYGWPCRSSISKENHNGPET
jgi:hypothetical protein